ncbi:MAG: tetratricopeptide repeat protein [Vampirovibrio sp.]|nr:tetratricopeptide repeat protein [Vampirovibrio sp.]
MGTPTFIHYKIIQRLTDGSFVANRRSKAGSVGIQDRRDMVSPLAVTKRCVRYEPNVFANRKPLIIKMANTLNDSAKKLTLVSGSQGCGKTSLVRGVVELMGGGEEQVLWFDVSIHTGFEEIIDFLIQYIAYICKALSVSGSTTEVMTKMQSQSTEVPHDLAQLKAMLDSVAQVPLLLVVDNMEHIVDHDFALRSQPFKELLNFLLSFPNIKMVLLGERLPVSDMSSRPELLTSIKLGGLEESDFMEILAGHTLKAEDADLNAQHWQEVYQKTHGDPWLIRILLRLSRWTDGDAEKTSQVLEIFDSQPDILLEQLVWFIYQQLAPLEQQVVRLLCFLRHPTDLSAVIAMSRFCLPDFPVADERQFQQQLEKSLLISLMKRTFPPQAVLAHVQERHQSPKTFHPWYEFYRQVKKVIYRQLFQEERSRIHQQLQEFYLLEKNKPFAQRVYRVKSADLIEEARHHGNAMRKRRATMESSQAMMDTKAYFYKSIQPGPSPKLYTLGDYREMDLPEDLSEREAIPKTLPPTPEKEVFQAVGEDPWDVSSSDDLALTEEEKQLLYGEESPLKEEISPKPNLFHNTQVSEPEVYQHSEDINLAESPSGHTDPMETQIKQALAQAVASQNRGQMAEQLIALARHRISKGRHSAGKHCLEKVLAMAAEIPVLQAVNAHQLFADIYREHQQLEPAQQHLQQAVELLEAGSLTEPEVLDQLGDLYQGLGLLLTADNDPASAIPYYEKALAYFTQAKNPYLTAELHFHLAETYDRLKQPEQALIQYQQSLVLDESNGNTASCAVTLANMGSIYLEQRSRTGYEKALACFEKSLAFDRDIGNLEGAFKTQDLMASTYSALRQPEKAEEIYSRLLALALRENNDTWKTLVYLKWGHLAHHLKNWTGALEKYQSALVFAPQVLTQKGIDLLQQKVREAEHGLQHHTL